MGFVRLSMCRQSVWPVLLAVCLCSKSLWADDSVLYLKMDGDMADSSGNAYDGMAFGGLQFVEGVSGRAASFDGVDDWVVVQGLPDEVFSDQDFTLSYWFNFPLNPRISIVSKREICNSAPFLDVRIEGWARMEMAIANGEDAASRAPRVYFTEGWHHFVGVREGTEIRAYLDGELVGTAETPSLYNIQNSIDFGLGTSPCVGVDGTTLPVGLMDELRVHARALSAEEAQDLFLGAVFADGFESGDVSIWTSVVP